MKLLNTVICFVLAILIVAQEDIDGNPLIVGWKGLAFTAYALLFTGYLNLWSAWKSHNKSQA